MRLWIVFIACVLLAAAWAQPELAPVPIAQETDTARLLIIANKGKPADRMQAITRLGRLHFRDAAPDLIPMLADPDAGIRAAAAMALGSICKWQPEKVDDRAVLPLTQLLKDDAAPVRAAAARALGIIRAPASADGLATLMEKDTDAAVRKAAVIALTEMDDVRAYEPLREMVKTADKQALREIAWVLSEKDNPQALDIQIAMLAAGDSAVRGIMLEHFSYSRYPGIVPAVCAVMDDPSPEVRRLAMECLRMQGDVQAVPALLAALADADPEVARLAGRAFSWRGNFLLQDKAIPDLLEALNSPKASARAAALEGLYGSKDPRISAAVIPLMSDKDAGVRAAAARTLGGLEDPRALEPLIILLNSPDAKHRISTAEALGALKRKEAVAPLLPLLKDPDTEVRRATAEALGKIHDPSAVDALLAALTEKNNYVRSRIVGALGACRDKKAAPILLALLQTEKDEWVLSAAVDAFRLIREPRCVELIQAISPKSKVIVHMACLDVLATYPSTQVKDMIIQDMQSEDALVREFAVQLALTEKIRDPRMVPILLKALQHPDTDRGEVPLAMIILSLMKEKRATPLMIQLLGSKIPAIRRHAVQSLGRLGDEKAIPALLPLVDDPELGIDAQSALLRLGHQESLEKLVAAAGAKDDVMRRIAVYALVQSGNPRALAIVQGMLLDPQSPNRLAAAFNVVSRLTPEMIDPLLAMANGRDPDERKLAALALIGSTDPRALAVQQRILREGKDALPATATNAYLPSLLLQAAASLAKQGDPEGMAFLIAAVREYDEKASYIQREAANTLAGITGQDFRLDADQWEAWWKEKQKADGKE